MTKDLPSFQRYQQEFSAYLRDPVHQPLPQNVSADRMAVYEEIVLNNIVESISACFPVAQKVLGKRAWLTLARDFLCAHSANSPIFRKIPEEFLDFLSKQANLSDSKLPPYLTSLCHYEWVELAVAATDKANIGLLEINPIGDLLASRPAFTPAMQLLNYDYAVHKISPRHKPERRESTQLLVYRNTEDTVQFVELNPVTHKLIGLLRQEAITGQQALMLVANELHHLQPATVLQFGLEVLENLRKLGIILGVYSLIGQ